MITEALVTAGRDPTGVAGGRVGVWGGNLRAGAGSVHVVEADEYDRSFLALRPDIAVVTNVEADHLDVYAGLAEIRLAFEQFLAPARTVALCADDQGAASLKVTSGAEVLRYGIASPDARVTASEIMNVDGRLRLLVSYDGDALGEIRLQVPGVHNARNALGAIAAGLALGVSLDEMRAGSNSSKGWSEDSSALGPCGGGGGGRLRPSSHGDSRHAGRGARGIPGRRIVAAFQPHLFTRTRDFAAGFGGALARADAVFLTEIYPARERPLPGVTSDLVAEAVRDAGGTVEWRGERAQLATALARAVRDGDVVITLGAGDITKSGPELLRRLAAGS